MRLAIIGIALGLAACQPGTTMQAVITAPPVVGALSDLALDYGHKACAVLDWGIPIADSRQATWTPRQQQALAISKQVMAAGCRLADASWRVRATAAGVELVQALWGLTR